MQPAPKSRRTEVDEESNYSAPQWNTSFKNKFAGKSDEDLREEVHSLYTELKALEAVKPEVARMMVVDLLEVTDAEKYRPKMVGYVGYNNFEIIDNINQTKQLLKAKDSQSQRTYGRSPIPPPRIPVVKPNTYKPRGKSQLPRMSPASTTSKPVSTTSKASNKAPATVNTENAYSDLPERQTTLGANSNKLVIPPMEKIVEKSERQKLQEKYALIRKERQTN